MHWHVAVIHGFGHVFPEKEKVYWVMNDAWAEMHRRDMQASRFVWTIVECRDLECVLREMV